MTIGLLEITAAGLFALAVLHQVDAGKLKLDSNVNEYLTSWKLPDNEFTREQKVSLRRILSHTAGVTVHGFPGYEAGTTLPTDVQILDGTSSFRLPALTPDPLPAGTVTMGVGAVRIIGGPVFDPSSFAVASLMGDVFTSINGITFTH